MTKATTLAQIAGTIIASLAGKAAAAHTHDPADLNVSTDIGIFLDAANATAGRRALSAMGAPDCIFHDERALNTNGQDGATSWTRKTLNTTVTNTLSGASLDTTTNVGRVTLPIGRYWIDYSGVCFGASGKVRLYNVTTATMIQESICNYNNATAVNAPHDVSALVVCGVATQIEVQLISAGAGSTRFGSAINLGSKEVYARLRIWQLAAS